MKDAAIVANKLIVPSEALVISGVLGVLQHPIRLMMVCELLEGELCAGDLTARFGTTKGNISQHLTLLLRHEIIGREARANKNFYRIKDPRIAVLLRVLKENFCPHGHSHPLASQVSTIHSPIQMIQGTNHVQPV